MLTPEEKVDIRAHIEKVWLGRAKEQGYKPGTTQYKHMELEFFTGAMATLNALFPADEDYLSSAVPVIWVVNALSGRPIVE